jgi:hypothetical protein
MKRSNSDSKAAVSSNRERKERTQSSSLSTIQDRSSESSSSDEDNDEDDKDLDRRPRRRRNTRDGDDAGGGGGSRHHRHKQGNFNKNEQKKTESASSLPSKSVAAKPKRKTGGKKKNTAAIGEGGNATMTASATITGKKPGRRSGGLSKNPVKLPYNNKRFNDYFLLKRDDRAIILHNVWRMLVQQHGCEIEGWDEARVKGLLEEANRDLTDIGSDDKELFVPFPYTAEQEPPLSKIEFRRQVNWKIHSADRKYTIGLFLLSTLGVPTLKNLRAKLPTNSDHQRAILIVDHVVYQSCLKKHMPDVLIFESSMFIDDFVEQHYNWQCPQRALTKEEIERLRAQFGKQFSVISANTISLQYFYGFHIPKMIRYRRSSETAGYRDYDRYVARRE